MESMQQGVTRADVHARLLCSEPVDAELAALDLARNEIGELTGERTLVVEFPRPVRPPHV